MATLFVATDPLGMVVECDSRWWREHIVYEHPEMNGRESLALLTIQSPLEVYQSRSHPRRHVFYRATQELPPGDLTYVRVVVEYETTWLLGKRRGRVITAFQAANIREGDLLIWPTPAKGE